MKKLVAFLMEHLFLDFDGTVDLDTVREFLREDDSEEARALASRLVEDRGVEQLLTVVADCLKDNLRNGVDESVLLEHVRTYAES